MAAITERHTAKEDVTVMTVDGADVLAIFRTASLEITADEIDVTAAQDNWKMREFGTFDWRVTASTLLTATPKFVMSVISGGTIVVSLSCTGFSFLGTGMMTNVPYNIDNPMTEECTVLSAGAAPTISTS